MSKNVLHLICCQFIFIYSISISCRPGVAIKCAYCPSPCLKLTILISFYLARLLPFPHTRFGRYQKERLTCVWSDWPWAGGHPCTDEILISYVNSAKNSLTVITHLYFLVYVSRNILHWICCLFLFYVCSCGPGVAIKCAYSPSPLSNLTILISL